MITVFYWVIGVLVTFFILVPALLLWFMVYLAKKTDEYYIRPTRRPF